MSSLRRAFVAVVPPADAIDHVDAALARVRAQFPQLRYAPRAQWHVTVRFLGRVDDADALVDDLRAGVAGAAPFVARLGGAGAFARARSGTVVWVGMREGVVPLTALARAVGADEPYRPHLTVADRARRGPPARSCCSRATPVPRAPCTPRSPGSGSPAAAPRTMLDPERLFG